MIEKKQKEKWITFCLSLADTSEYVKQELCNLANKIPNNTIATAYIKMKYKKIVLEVKK